MCVCVCVCVYIHAERAGAVRHVSRCVIAAAAATRGTAACATQGLPRRVAARLAQGCSPARMHGATAPDSECGVSRLGCMCIGLSRMQPGVRCIAARVAGGGALLERHGPKVSLIHHGVQPAATGMRASSLQPHASSL